VKISVVITHFNRPHLLHTTLLSIGNFSNNKNVEVIIVDDASSDDNYDLLHDVIDNVELTFPNLKVLLLSISPKQKTWVNPCIAFNKGINITLGDIVILQNAENMWIDSIDSHILQTLKPNDYSVYSCYSISLEKTNNLLALLNDLKYPCVNLRNYIDKMISPINNKPANIDGDDSWYQHYDIRNVNYHFCSAIYKKDLLEIGKFDERYAYGIGYDDDDLLQKIKQKGLNIVNYNFPYVIHQNHSNIRSNHDNPLKTVDNYSLFNSIWKK